MNDWVLAVGLLVGVVALGSACLVWVKKQQFGFGGAVLCALGTVLIGMGIWRSVSVTVSDGGMEFSAVQADVDEAVDAALQMAEELDSLSRGLEGVKSQLIELAEQLAAQGSASSASARAIRTNIQLLPTANVARLDSVVTRLATGACIVSAGSDRARVDDVTRAACDAMAERMRGTAAWTPTGRN